MWSVWLNCSISSVVQGTKVCLGVCSDTVFVCAVQRVHMNMTKFVTVCHSSARYMPCLGTQCCHSFSFLVFLILCFYSHVDGCGAPSLTTHKVAECCNPVDQSMCCHIIWQNELCTKRNCSLKMAKNWGWNMSEQ